MTSPARDEFLRVPDVSRMTGTPGDTLRTWRKRNIGPKSFLMHGRIVYRRSEVEAWIESVEAATARGGAA